MTTFSTEKVARAALASPQLLKTGPVTYARFDIEVGKQLQRTSEVTMRRRQLLAPLSTRGPASIPRGIEQHRHARTRASGARVTVQALVVEALTHWLGRKERHRSARAA